MTQRFNFRRDNAVWDSNGNEISLMVLWEAKSKMLCDYLARCRGSDGHFRYAQVRWDAKAGQFQANNSFCGGHTGSALNYVARWYPSPRRALSPAYR